MPLPPVPQRTTPGICFSLVGRALRDCIAERRFGKAERETCAAAFDYACAFCGGAIERWDHLVPVSAGGDTVLGNMVPACSRCDDSKQALPFEEWARGKAPGSPATRGVTELEARLTRIKEYAAAHGYQAFQPKDRLTEDELALYERIRQDLAQARADIDALLLAYRKRTGLT